MNFIDTVATVLANTEMKHSMREAMISEMIENLEPVEADRFMAIALGVIEV
jgi:hypothetical protein